MFAKSQNSWAIASKVSYINHQFSFQILILEGFKEGEDPEAGIKLDIDSEILEICIKFMHYKTV